MSTLIAFATSKIAFGYDKDLEILSESMRQRNMDWECVNWDDKEVDWSKYSYVKIHSTWDYQDRIHEFRDWLSLVSKQTRLHNSYDIITWNIDKRYLRELQAAGLATIKTVFLETTEQLDALSANALHSVRDSDTDNYENVFAGDVIIKPAISAGANNTARYVGDAAGAIAHARAILTTGRFTEDGGEGDTTRTNKESASASVGMTVLVQPYQHAIDAHGETALVYLRGQFSHALRKSPIFKLSSPSSSSSSSSSSSGAPMPGHDAHMSSAESNIDSQASDAHPHTHTHTGGAVAQNGLFRATEVVLNTANVSPAERAFGARVMEFLTGKFGVAPLYARVDLVTNFEGTIEIMEVELTEPCLFLHLDPSGAAAARAAATYHSAVAADSTEASRP